MSVRVILAVLFAVIALIIGLWMGIKGVTNVGEWAGFGIALTALAILFMVVPVDNRPRV